MCVHCRTGKKLNIMKMKNPFLSFLELRECKKKPKQRQNVMLYMEVQSNWRLLMVKNVELDTQQTPAQEWQRTTEERWKKGMKRI